jgi:arylsulfatase A-like enzyme
MKQSQLPWCGLLLLVLTFSHDLGYGRAWSQQPNILLIFADDLGYGDVSTYQPGDVQTPNIDSLARQGMLFTNMRANCTVCSPSRAALLTGKFPDRVGVPGVIRTNPEDSFGFFDPQAVTLATMLKRQNYTTAIIGKWHLGLESPNTPNERGFDFFHGFLGDMMDSYWDHRRHGNNYMRRNQEVIDPKGHATTLFSDWAIDYLNQRAGHDQPFFLYLAYNAPHFPIEPPPQWLERVQQRNPQLSPARTKNVAFVEHLDFEVGRVLVALRELGQEHNTLVVFTSDNGGSLPHAQNNGPWRDGKQSHYDGGLRVPFMIRWPAKVDAGTTTDYPGLNFDLFPTFVQSAGGEIPSGLDAISLLPLLENPAIGGQMQQQPRELYFCRREGGVAYGGKSYEAIVRWPWKLMQNSPYGSLELYNLAEDPGETQNVIEANKSLANELSVALRRHIQRGGSVVWQRPEQK